MENKNFGKLIKQRLKERNMTQEKLADKLGVTPSQVSHYLLEKNEIPHQNVVQICKLLDLNLNEYYQIYDSDINEEEMHLIEEYRHLKSKHQKELSNYLSYLRYKQEHNQ